jgi:hypothetical protein
MQWRFFFFSSCVKLLNHIIGEQCVELLVVKQPIAELAIF